MREYTTGERTDPEQNDSEQADCKCLPTSDFQQGGLALWSHDEPKPTKSREQYNVRSGCVVSLGIHTVSHPPASQIGVPVFWA
ncbi:MAG TPA: hypothetical protein VIS99_11820 [Terrimicrobiaceae bacterium]